MEESIMNSCKKKLSEQIIYVMMNLSQTNTKDFDLLVFQDRNQAYGAYALRKSYSSTMLKSLLIGVAFTASLLAAPYLSDLMSKKKLMVDLPKVDKTVLVDLPVDDPEEPKPKVDDPAPPVEANTSTHLAPEITTDVVDEPLTTLRDLELSDPGTTTHHGDPGEWGIPNTCVDCEGVTGNEPENKVHDFVTLEEKPEFPGGEEAMWKFFNENLVYPQHAKDIQLQGRVYVTFVIDEWGNVTKVAVPREIGGGLDEEAKRVVSMMPRWSPGRQAGRPVKVSFQLPISFKLQ